MTAPDTGNLGTVTFSGGFAVDWTSVGGFTMRVPQLNSSKLSTIINEETVAGDLAELDMIEITYWFDPEFDQATKEPPFISIKDAAQADETITIGYPVQSGHTTALLIAGLGRISEYAHPAMNNNELGAATFSVQYAGGAAGPSWTDPT